MEHLKNNNLDEHIKSGLCLVDFYAQWCGPCKMLAPVLENLDNEIKIIKVDIDENEKLTNEYRIMSVPTLMIFKDGVKQDEIIGFRSEDELREEIEKYK